MVTIVARRSYIREQIEKQLAAGAVEGHEAQFIDDEESTRSSRC